MKDIEKTLSQQSASDAKIEQPRKPSGPVRILVVDDERVVADIMRDFLAEEGYVVTVARSLANAKG